MDKGSFSGEMGSSHGNLSGNPKSFNRYSYVLNDPILFNDPSGHKISCDDGPQSWKSCGDQLEKYANDQLKRNGRKDDLGAMVNIVNKAAQLYGDFDEMLSMLSSIFIGVNRYGPGTLWAAKNTGCAGVGREPHDCLGATDYFGDQGFHPDFQDGHNQLFHLWGYVAETAAPGNSFKGGLGILIGTGANVFHEVAQSILRYPDHRWGTSWQDFELSGQGMYIGSLITTGSIKPSELGAAIMNNVGAQGPGSGGEFQMFSGFFGPLAGQQIP